jgi:hypothetical protein
VIELTKPFTLILILNSFLLITLILNQNESTKESTSSQNLGSINNPFENFTWISLIFQFVLLLLKTKITDF